MRIRLMVTAAAGLVAGLVATGCGEAGGPRPPTGKVHGKVTLNGKPVTKGIVTFVPIMGKGGESGDSASGDIESDGSFTLTTFNTGDGAVLGQHVATVREEFTPPPGDSKDGQSGGKIPEFDKRNRTMSAPPKRTIPAKYANIDSSPLKYTVEKGNNDFTIELKD